MGFIKITETEIVWEGENERFCVETCGDGCFRFRSSASLHILDKDWSLLPQKKTKGKVIRNKEWIILENGSLRVKAEKSGKISYWTKEGKKLLEEDWKDRRESLPPIRKAREYKWQGGSLFKTDLYFKAETEEKFYGMGQHADGCLNIKGCTIEMAQKNTQTIIPYVISSKGYGFVWNNPAIGQAEFVKNHTRWHAEATDQMDYLIFAGKTPREIHQIFCRLYGKAPEFPDWAVGYWQSKLRYETQEELLKAAREHVKKRGLPMDVIVVDFYHWSQHGEWKFNPSQWPDPEAMIQELENMGVKLAVSIWPTVDQRSENFSYMKSRNMLMRTERNAQVVKMSNGPLIYYDATNPKARKFVWRCVKKHYYDNGVRIFWLDESEPGMLPYDYDNVRYHIGGGLEVSSIYPYMYAEGFYEGQKKAGQDKIANLVRSAWLGSQRFGIILWSGDIPSTFESLEKQIKVGISAGMSGIPWWTTDIGGFFDGNGQEEKFRELLIRWFQFGAFCPVFRMHGNRFPYSSRPHGMTEYTPTSGENQVWSYGEKVYGIMKKFLFIRERMKPYIMETMDEASKEGTPVIRSMFFEFPEDEICWEIEDQYMFGEALLVCPVYCYQERKRRLYLPEGEEWIDWRTGKKYKGGQWIEVDAPLEDIPVFVREKKKDLIKCFYEKEREGEKGE